MQVDGEAIRLNPANIELKFLNQCCMLAKTKNTKSKPVHDQDMDSSLKLNVSRIKMDDYEVHHYNKDKIKEFASQFVEINTSASADLDQVRSLITKTQENNNCAVSNGWCFVDAVTAGRFFRIDRAQENIHYVLDICDGSTLFILDEEQDEDEDEEEDELVGEGNDSPRVKKSHHTQAQPPKNHHRRMVSDDFHNSSSNMKLQPSMILNISFFFLLIAG